MLPPEFTSRPIRESVLLALADEELQRCGRGRVRGPEGGQDPFQRSIGNNQPLTCDRSIRSTQQAGFREPAGETLGVFGPQRASADVFAERILRVDLLELGPYPAGLVDLT